MVSETVDTKARRYLVEGRVQVLRVTSDRVFAEVRGGAVYQAGWSNGQWWCTCPARKHCAHLEALDWIIATDAKRADHEKLGSRTV